MVDLHNHILFGVDDGSPDIATSIAMIEQAVSQGVTSIASTSHVDGYADQIPRLERFSSVFIELETEVRSREIPVKLKRSCEVMWKSDLESIADIEKFTYDQQGKYILIEFPANEVPRYFPHTVFQLSLRRITPIIAHPERNLVLLRKPQLLAEFIRLGALTQLTNGSVLGRFGKEIQNFAQSILKANACTIMASDAHDLKYRTFLDHRESFERVAELTSSATADLLFTQVPQKIFDGDFVAPAQLSPSDERILCQPSKSSRLLFWK